jgi:TolA-binding protein
LLFPGHSLADDVYYTKAQYLSKTGQIDEAIVLYQSIMNEFPDEIRADNAIYALAQIYEQKVGDNEKAKELYEKLFMEYSDSTFAIDARKRFRILRGDNIQ